MSRRSDEALLISRLYAAAVEPNGLETMSELIRDHLDIDSAGLWIVRSGAVVDMANTPDIRESERPYLAYYRQLDPWTRSREPNGIVSLGSEMYDEAKLVSSEFYCDFARHYGMLRPMGASVMLDPETVLTVATNRLAGRLLGHGDKRRLQDLLTHVEAAMRLRLRFRAANAVAAWTMEALDRISFGTIVCDPNGAVLYANRAAEVASAEGGPLLLNGARQGCSAAKPSETACLLAMIAAAARGRSGAARLTSASGRSFPVLVTPCPDDFGPPDGAASVLVTISAVEPRLTVSLLQRVYGLSPAQSHLCIALAAGQTFEQIATARGVTVPTMRSHFAEILRRTGATNLRDLLRMLGELPQVVS